jgi:hypothetical protein
VGHNDRSADLACVFNFLLVVQGGDRICQIECDTSISIRQLKTKVEVEGGLKAAALAIYLPEVAQQLGAGAECHACGLRATSNTLRTLDVRFSKKIQDFKLSAVVILRSQSVKFRVPRITTLQKMNNYNIPKMNNYNIQKMNNYNIQKMNNYNMQKMNNYNMQKNGNMADIIPDLGWKLLIHIGPFNRAL